MVSKLSEIWSGFFIPDPDPDFLTIPDPDLESQIPAPGGQNSTGSQIRIRKTGDFRFALAVGGSVVYWFSTRAAVLITHSMDQLSEAFMCKKGLSVCFISTQSL